MFSIQINRCCPMVLLLVMLAGRGTEAGDFPPEGTQPLPVRIESGADQLDLFVGEKRFCGSQSVWS
jgi:hypothetical protein